METIHHGDGDFGNNTFSKLNYDNINDVIKDNKLHTEIQTINIALQSLVTEAMSSAHRNVNKRNVNKRLVRSGNALCQSRARVSLSADNKFISVPLCCR